MSAVSIAVDIGGTFTDLIAFDHGAGELRHAKALTTPDDLVRGVLDCLAASGDALERAEEIVHGSTIAINTVLERTGAPTALLVTEGMRDVYAIGRGNRPQAYRLFFRRPQPLVPRRLTFEVPGRILASGAVAKELDEDAVLDVAARLRESGVEAVAVCLLHAYANPVHERRVGELLRRELPDCYLSLSHEVLREYREYERTSTTVLNSYVGPVVSRYVGGLRSRLESRAFAGTLWLMRSNGGVATPASAARRPVTMMESGPAGGIIGAAHVAAALGFPDVIAFDMGGTTAKASLIRDGAPSVADGYHVGGYAEGQPVRSPVVDIVEVGTGGGSIAWLDDVGALKVGPRSAGAHPGPIAYARGGTRPTITDANVVLGRIRADAFMGGTMPLDEDAAYAGIAEHVAMPLGLDPVEAARGIVDIAIAKMSLAVREVSVARGHDPREFALLASGGAGPLHAVAIARELHVPRVVIPRLPGHFSAAGMLVADQQHDFVQTVHVRVGDGSGRALTAYRELVAAALGEPGARGTPEVRLEASADMRYQGQEFSLAVPTTEAELAEADLATVRRRFDEVHHRRYGHQAPDEDAEIVNLRLRAVVDRRKPPLSGGTAGGDAPDVVGHVEVHLDPGAEPAAVPVHHRDDLAAGTRVEGPALIQEHASTTVLYSGDVCDVADGGELVVTLMEARER